MGLVCRQPDSGGWLRWDGLWGVQDGGALWSAATLTGKQVHQFLFIIFIYILQWNVFGFIYWKRCLGMCLCQFNTIEVKINPQASVGRFSQLTLALSAGTDLFFECHSAAFSRLWRFKHFIVTFSAFMLGVVAFLVCMIDVCLFL